MTFILKHTGEDQTIDLNGEYQDIFEDEPVTGSIVVPPLDVRILET